MEASLEGNSFVELTRYLIFISFQGGMFRPNRPVFNLNILYGLDPHATHTGKGRKLSGSVFYWVIQNKL